MILLYFLIEYEKTNVQKLLDTFLLPPLRQNLLYR